MSQRRLPRRLRSGPRAGCADGVRSGQRRSRRRTAGSGRWSRPTDPTVVDSLSILIEGDDNPVKTLTEIHQPDNLETTAERAVHHGGSRAAASSSAATGHGSGQRDDARLWQYKFSRRDRRHPRRVIKVDQSADEGPTDVDARQPPGTGAPGRRPASSTCRRCSDPGKFLVERPGTHPVGSTDSRHRPATTGPYKREGGQLLLVTIPGG